MMRRGKDKMRVCKDDLRRRILPAIVAFSVFVDWQLKMKVDLLSSSQP